MLETLSSVRSSGALNIAGVCPTSDEFTRLVNEATSRLMRRGDWSGTALPIYVCIKRGCVVFPRYVLQVRKLNYGRHPVSVKNNWYEFFDTRSWRGACGAKAGVIGQSQTPVFQDVQGEGRLIRAYTRVQNDVGKTIKIFGVDNSGQPLTEKVAGTWVQGITLTLAIPFVSSSVFVRRIDRVLKDETEAPINLYAYNSTDDVLEDLAQYDGSETNPSYSKYQINICGGNGACGDSFPITAMVKLRFVPVKNADDLVLIGNLDALKDMMQSIRLREAGDSDGANTFEASAIRELNLQLRDESPEDEMPVDFGETGRGGRWGRQKVF